MMPVLIATVLGVVAAIVLVIGVFGLLRPRKVHIVDYPELPPPAPEEQDTRTANAG